jgi:Got1/Sft2-like family
MSFKFFIELIEGYPVPFAVNYTAGNILSQCASWFLCGPKRQFRNMFDERRKLTATVYLSCMVATLVVVFLPLPWASKLATLVLLLLTQCGASFWYSLSYIPFGRRTVKKIIFRMLGISQYNEPPAEGN